MQRRGESYSDAIIITAQGSRAAVSSIFNGSGLWTPDAVEAKQPHFEGNARVRLYARAEFWDERVRMMQWWADRLDEFKAGVS